jgi:hypothetical protein
VRVPDVRGTKKPEPPLSVPHSHIARNTCMFLSFPFLRDHGCDLSPFAHTVPHVFHSIEQICNVPKAEP